MMWKVRALLEDRPGAMAALAAGCGEHDVNILGLQIFPAADGRVVDELVLHTPGGWRAADVERLCAGAGVEAPLVTPCPPQALEDQPVRYLRAAQLVREDPDRLEEVLCRLLDAVPADRVPGAAALDLRDGTGRRVSLARATPFTDTEVARVTELRRLVAEEPSPARERPTGTPVVRRGGVEDADALIALHTRCSAQTLYRRYHAPVAHVTRRMARALLDPAQGASLLLTVGEEVVAAGMFSADPAGEPGEAELGLMVEDSWQQQGHGARLLRALAVEAAGLGLDTLTCLVQPDNDAVLRTIRRSGLRVRAAYADGMTRYRIPLAALRPREASAGRRRGNRPQMADVTSGLVSLLHDRRELREVYPPADLIDQAVRGGA